YSSVNSITFIPRNSTLLCNRTMDNKEIRRANMLMLAEQLGSLRKLADVTETDSTYLSNIKNRVKNRGMGDDVARRFEAKLDKPRGWMDRLQVPGYAIGTLEDAEAPEYGRGV